MFDILAYISTTRRAMDKWRQQPNSVHQIGSETPLVAFLIVDWCCLIDGWKYWPEFFTLECFCLLLNNQGNHWQTEATGGFNASNRSRKIPGSFSDCRLLMVYKRVKIPPDLGDILVPRNFIFWLVAKNQGSYGQTDTTERFSASNRSRNTSLRWSDCRLVMLYIVVKKLWAEFLCPEILCFGL